MVYLVALWLDMIGFQHRTQVACAHLSDGTARQVTLRETRVMSGDDARGEWNVDEFGQLI